QARVILCAARRDRLNADRVLDEALVIRAAVRIRRRAIDSGDLAKRAAEQRQLRADARVWARDARDGEPHGLDAAEVLAREVEVVDDLRQLEGALPGLAELLESFSVQHRQRDRLLDLELALVAFEVADLHAFEVVNQLFAREQPLVKAVLIT